MANGFYYLSYSFPAGCETSGNQTEWCRDYLITENDMNILKDPMDFIAKPNVWEIRQVSGKKDTYYFGLPGTKLTEVKITKTTSPDGKTVYGFRRTSDNFVFTRDIRETANDNKLSYRQESTVTPLVFFETLLVGANLPEYRYKPQPFALPTASRYEVTVGGAGNGQVNQKSMPYLQRLNLYIIRDIYSKCWRRSYLYNAGVMGTLVAEVELSDSTVRSSKITGGSLKGRDQRLETCVADTLGRFSRYLRPVGDVSVTYTIDLRIQR